MDQIPDGYKKLLFNKESNELLTTEEQQIWDDYLVWQQYPQYPEQITDENLESVVALHFEQEKGKWKAWEKLQTKLPKKQPAPVVPMEPLKQKVRWMDAKAVATVTGLALFSLMLAKSTRPAHETTQLLVFSAEEKIRSITLPDKTMVVLNEGSSIRYPSRFTSTERAVELTGEGCFDVAADAAHPFIVKTQMNEVTAEGTKFNIQAYTRDSIVRTTLLQGKVFVKRGEEIVTMIPGQQLIQEEHTHRSLFGITSDNALAWQNGRIVFEKQDLVSVMQQIRRHYDVGYVIIGDPPAFDLPDYVSAKIPLDKLLERMSASTMINFKLESNIINVSERKY